MELSLKTIIQVAVELHLHFYLSPDMSFGPTCQTCDFYRSFPSAGMNWVFTICLLVSSEGSASKIMQNFILMWKRNKNASGYDEIVLAHPDQNLYSLVLHILLPSKCILTFLT